MAFNPGDVLSHYRIVEMLGEGGMGLVYRAEDLRLQRQVALKVLSGDSRVGGEPRSRLLREARAAAALNHPNICTIYEVHEEGDTSFIAMELVEGETLHEILRRPGSLPLDRLLDIALQVAGGLSEAHAHRIVHRDLKPQNVMVTAQGRVKILDFGLAKAPAAREADDPDLTTTRTLSGRGHETMAIYGTIAYLSPEQALGKEVDARSDLFSFGTMLYEMTTGRPPFVGDGPTATIARILEAEPESPARLNPALPVSLERVVHRCLRKSPAQRYDDAYDLVRALEEVRHAHTDAEPGSTSLSDTTIAVFPFVVRGSDRFAYLGEGMVDLLSTKLDGAGTLRSVDAHVILGSLAREGGVVLTPARALELARNFGAGLCVLGNILEVGGQLHLDASLYEFCEGETAMAKASVRGDASHIFDLVDDLTAQLLTNRCGGPEARFTRIAALATGSFPALKAYLEGEAEMRAMRRAQAVDAYRRSVAADPGFALAWYRMSVAALWAGQPDVAREAARQAAQHGQRLSERDSRLLQAFQAVLSGANREAKRLYRTILGAHSDDVEAWYQLGEILFHHGPLRGRPIADSRDAWERVILLDPGHVNALVHLGAIVASGGDRAGIEKLVKRVLELSPGGDAALSMRAMCAFALGDAARQDKLIGDLRRAGDQAVNWAIRFVGAFLGDLEGGCRLAALLTEPVRSPAVRALGHVLRAYFALARGRWEAAQAELTAAARLDPALAVVHRAFLSAVPVSPASPTQLETVRAELERWDPPASGSVSGSVSWLLPHAGLERHLRLYLLGLVGIRLGDHASVPGRIAALEALEAPPDCGAVVDELTRGLRGQVSWAQGRREEGLSTLVEADREIRFDLTFLSPFHSQTAERFALAEWLRELGRDREALPWYSSFEGGSIYDLACASYAHFRSAVLYERLGEPTRAAEHYRRFAAAWSDCDAGLRPRREEAESGLKRLGKKST